MPTMQRFSIGLNTATIMGQKLDLRQQVDIVIKAGYDGLEPWIRDIEAYATSGGSLEDIAKRCADNNIKIPSAIGFAAWIEQDDAKRKAALEQAQRDMELVRRIGGTAIAAPPVGATNGPKLEAAAIAERYRALLVLGHHIGVIPQLEVWGFSTNMQRLSDVLQIAAETGHDEACVLADAYHLHKGGSHVEGLRLLGKTAVRVFHINDYPADPPREAIADEHRIYPGDGVASLTDILQGLAGNDCFPMLTLELFNRELWKQDALEVATTGLAKIKAVLQKAEVAAMRNARLPHTA